MSHATLASPSVDAAEVAKFAALAEQWWDPLGSFAPLHKFNPVRLKFIRDTCIEHFEREEKSLRPFEGLTLLDLGCGGGLLAEPMARLGFDVTGCDAGEETVHAATLHAERAGLPIAYRCATAELLASEGARFDVVLCMEIIEHVPVPREFIDVTARLLAPGGIIFVATLNKTLKSFALAKIAAEYMLRWLPAGTHDWNRFLPPRLVCAMIEDAGLRVKEIQGMMFDPLLWNWRLARDTDVNYVVVAEHAKS